jgi:hypothetical protein
MNVEQIAELAHEANRTYCLMQGDASQFPWAWAPAWQKTSAINGVKFHIKNPDAGCSGSHENWLKEKYATGWKYGNVKDPIRKEHPCCVPYDELPKEQKVKDALFVGIVRAMQSLLTKGEQE